MQQADPITDGNVERYGEVFDRGYAHYRGPRLGRRQAFRSLIGYSIKRAMGIRKSWSAKVLPFLLYASVLIPVVVMIGIDAVVPDFGFTSYTNYISWTFVVIGIFVAMSAPEMLCVDRKERTLPLYFSRAIARSDYVMAKVLAMTLLTMTMSLIPMVILWLGQQLSADSVWQAIRSNLDDLGRVILIGALIALFLGVLGLVVSSITDRKGVAIAIIFIGFIVLTGIANGAMELLEGEDWSRYVILLSFSDLFIAISDHLFNDAAPGEQWMVEEADLPLSVYIGYVASVIVLGIVFLRWRYSPRDDS
jgi:ABC-2 type transport system permease protein